MAITPLTNSQRDQFALHIDELAAAWRELESEPSLTAARAANSALHHYETGAGGFPGTGRNVGVQNGLTLSIPETNQLAAECNSLASMIEHDGAVASDTANEMLELFEERELGLTTPEAGQRDVTQQQLPR